jgi:hypothetical protein
MHKDKKEFIASGDIARAHRLVALKLALLRKIGGASPQHT